jgi:hypothetical protein
LVAVWVILEVIAVFSGFNQFCLLEKNSKMYSTVLALHNLFRWIALIVLLYALYRAYTGMAGKRSFTRHDNSVRLWTATLAHIQLLIGLLLYFISPIMKYFLKNFSSAVEQTEIRFFGMEHSLLMIVAIVVLTIGSAKSKRKSSSYAKFRTMALWFTIALVIMFVSIPWPFMPFPQRPYFRTF